ncbi:shikimate kinase [Pyrofollis japonicus]|uniref:shikimate kinase n=1 Tax=Pyrofollis japonicus TaxID=3060460 RepID=UPI00295B9697|nr:shikimate kinase [Pyrofollis japonicus]BEP17813.1 shikimate kinase [Pyrofollis japonicus]
METARGRAHGAIGVVNAIGTGGLGAATAIDLWLSVEAWKCSKPRGYTITRSTRVEVDKAILEAVADTLSKHVGKGIGSLCIRGISDIPLEAGLKGSSALINAALEAGLRLLGYQSSLLELAKLGVEVARAAGLTITGALDDHLAVSGCGTYATNNASQQLLRHIDGPEGLVVIAVPGRRSIKSIDREAFEIYQPLYLAAWRLLEDGDWGKTVLVNGVATALATGTSAEPLFELIRSEAETAGISGKGPAVYAFKSTGPIGSLVEKARKLFPKVVVTKTISCSSYTRSSYPALSSLKD